MASYRLQLYDFDTDYSPKDLVAEFENPKNLGYGSYLNDIGEAFFTIAQRDAKVGIRDYIGKSHLFIIREDRGYEDVVWRGLTGETDANATDVIIYSYGYEHLFHSLHSKWNKKFKSVAIAGASGRPVNYLWNRALTETDSPMQWMSTGTIQAPWTTDAQTTVLTLNKYELNWKPLLLALKELVAIATSDTNNVVYFEIGFPTDPTDKSATFNFYKDRSTDVTALRLEYPNTVMDWNDRFVPVMLRNKTFAVGSGPRGQVYRYNYGQGLGNYGRVAFGMHSQNLYLSWVRDRQELGRVTRRRNNLGLREDVNLMVRCWADRVPPWRSSAASWRLGDKVQTKISHGSTEIDKNLFMIGEQVVFANGREYVQPMLEDRT